MRACLEACQCVWFGLVAFRSLWLSFVEKAWARIHGSYAAIDVVGDAGHAMENLTGAPVESIPFDVSPAVWQHVSTALRDGATVAATLQESAGTLLPGVDLDTELGIVGAHEINGERVLRVAHFLSRATWANDRWTAEAKVSASPAPTALDDGGSTVWVSFSDAGALFERVHILHWHESWQFASTAGALSPAPGGVRRGGNIALFWVKLDSDSVGATWICLRQVAGRCVEDPTYKCFRASFCVLRVPDLTDGAASHGEDSDGFVGQSPYGAVEALRLPVSTRAGSHLVVVSGEDAGIGQRFMVSVYASSRARITRAVMSANDFDELFKRACSAQAWASGTRISFGSDDVVGELRCSTVGVRHSVALARCILAVRSRVLHRDSKWCHRQVRAVAFFHSLSKI